MTYKTLKPRKEHKKYMQDAIEQSIGIRVVIKLNNGQKVIAYVKIEDIGNDGIGRYEFWGMGGFDAGRNYVESFTITKLIAKDKTLTIDNVYDLIPDAEFERVCDLLTQANNL